MRGILLILGMVFFSGVEAETIVYPVVGSSGYSEFENPSRTYETIIIDNRIWLDRNLGATGTGTVANYGHLYQWGRSARGHQLRTSTAGTEGNDSVFWLTEDWASNDDDDDGSKRTAGWSSHDGSQEEFRSICPPDFVVPTEAELRAATTDAGITNAATAATNALKLPAAGRRRFDNEGVLEEVGSAGYYWTRESVGNHGVALYFIDNDATFYKNQRIADTPVASIAEIDNSALTDTEKATAKTNFINTFPSFGYSVRCIRDIFPPNIRLDAQPPVFLRNQLITPITFTNDGDAANWSISGNLPTGLSINRDTGEISGTPTEVKNADYTVTATTKNDNSLTDTATVTISVQNNLPPILTASHSSAEATIIYAAGNTATQIQERFNPITITDSNNVVDVNNYTISPDLPAGLSLASTDYATETGETVQIGAIRGVPTVSSPRRTYTITGYNKIDPNITATIDVIITVYLVPTITASALRTTAIVGQAITPITFTNIGDTATFTVFKSNETLTLSEIGLNFDPATGTISGTPTITADSVPQDYTVYATHYIKSAYAGTAPAQITINPAPATNIPPALTQNTATVIVTQRQAIPAIIFTNTGDQAAFDISPPLADGLNSNATDFKLTISGAPTGFFTTTYTITATHINHSELIDTATVSITSKPLIITASTNNGFADVPASELKAEGDAIFVGGLRAKFNYNGADSDLTYSASSSDETIATAAVEGNSRIKITPLAAGGAIITVSVVGDSNPQPHATQTFRITVRPIVNLAAVVAPTAITIGENQMAEYTVTLDKQVESGTVISVSFGYPADKINITGTNSDNDLTNSREIFFNEGSSWQASQTITISAKEADNATFDITHHVNYERVRGNYDFNNPTKLRVNIKGAIAKTSYKFNIITSASDAANNRANSDDTSAVLRYLFGSRGTSIIGGNSNTTDNQAAITAIENLQNIDGNPLNVDEIGAKADTKDATLILRYQLGARCNALTTGLADSNNCRAILRNIENLLSL